MYIVWSSILKQYSVYLSPDNYFFEIVSLMSHGYLTIKWLFNYIS